MSIPPEHSGRYVYHFSHIDNLPNLLRSGFLANNHKGFPRFGHHSIAASGIQKRRAEMAVPCGPGGCVHDYVPLYFGAISPMLLGVINAKNVDQMEILYFEFPISILQRGDVVFTNASANTVIPPQFFDNPDELCKLNWEAIDSRKWGNVNDDFRHQRMAEALVYGSLPLAAAARCVVWNEGIKKRVEDIVAEAGVPFPVIEFESPERRHWFTNFQEAARKGTSIVTGPREISMIFSAACQEMLSDIGKHQESAEFEDEVELLNALREDFGCLAQTAELVGLKSENGVHKRTVDVHTKEVVAKLLSLCEYGELKEGQRVLVELAAYLHDIGKGPRSRWDFNGGLQKVDPNHPVGAMPMMVNVLTRVVGNVSAIKATTLAKLVCYHDLVGEVLGKERDARQILDVVDNKSELDMLFALGKADATALAEHWWDETGAERLYDWCLESM